MAQKTLTWTDLRTLGHEDKGGRWYPKHPVAQQYIDDNGYRYPSRAWPNSYAKPLLTGKFAKWAKANHPEFAAEYGL